MWRWWWREKPAPWHWPRKILWPLCRRFPSTGRPNSPAPPDAPDGRLRFRVLDNSAVPTSVARDEPFCSGNTKKADRPSSDQRSIEISYSPPSSSSGIPTETFNVSISGKLDNFSHTTNFNYVFKNENQLIFDVSRDAYQVSTVVWKKRKKKRCPLDWKFIDYPC